MKRLSVIYAHLLRALDHARGASDRTRRMVLAALAAFQSMIAVSRAAA